MEIFRKLLGAFCLLTGARAGDRVMNGDFEQKLCTGWSVSKAGPEIFMGCLDGLVYLEGGDVWYYSPNFFGGHNFGLIFGINPIADGSNDLGPVVGESATFTEGMSLNYGGENSFIDRIGPTGNGSFLILRDFDQSYGCGVAKDGGTYRTVGTFLELGGLIDSIAPSTRATLLDSIMRFFDIKPVTGIAEQLAHSIIGNGVRLNVQPSLFRNSLWVRLVGHGLRSPIALQIYDVCGRVVKSLVISASGVDLWSGDDSYGFPLPSGIYFIHYDGLEERLIKKVVKVN
uniref:T9SS type A sorting domain-containing protein n=1 Tax=candidate division WOR-3 bacterium TaxID=2052148 RepID=A0A7V0Z6H1_UNCW3